MFLMPRRVPTQACLFNVMVPAHLGEMNGLLAEQGRTINVVSRKEFSVSGFAAPYYNEDTGEMDTRIKDDALYVWIIYEASDSCPWTAPDRAKTASDELKRAIAVAPRETAMKQHPDEFVIDLTAADLEVKAVKKKVRAAAKKPGKPKRLSETKFMKQVNEALVDVDFTDPHLDPGIVERVNAAGGLTVRPRAKKKAPVLPPEGSSI